MKNKAGFGEYTPFTASRHGRMVRKVPLPAALACRAAIVEAKAVVGWRGPACRDRTEGVLLGYYAFCTELCTENTPCRVSGVAFRLRYLSVKYLNGMCSWTATGRTIVCVSVCIVQDNALLTGRTSYKHGRALATTGTHRPTSTSSAAATKYSCVGGGRWAPRRAAGRRKGCW